MQHMEGLPVALQALSFLHPFTGLAGIPWTPREGPLGDFLLDNQQLPSHMEWIGQRSLKTRPGGGDLAFTMKFQPVSSMVWG
jgi:hypothetical protein